MIVSKALLTKILLNLNLQQPLPGRKESRRWTGRCTKACKNLMCRRK